ncbi:MAG TPA: dihydrofolate reductase family protein [Candidatus Acidoferrum sp.]|jgi:dihydrofolate reductase
MSKLIMWNLISLDGFFEGEKSWALDWHQYAWGDELERLSIEQLKAADGLLFGRVTYEGMAAYWQKETGEVAEFMNRLPKAVVSRTLERADWNNTTLIKGDLGGEVAKLKGKSGKDIYVFGSGKLSHTLMEHGLFDEYRIAVVPVILGSGKTLFGDGLKRQPLKLVETRTFSSGAVMMRYEPRV